MKQIVVKIMIIVGIMAAISVPPLAYADCGGAKTEFISCSDKAGLGAIGTVIKMAITIMTVLIGIIAVGGIGYAAVMYASARDNKSQVEQAIGIIRNVVIGLLLYGFSVAIINWLVPGGVIG